MSGDAAALAGFSIEDFCLRAARITAGRGDAVDGDHVLNPSLTHLILRDGLRDAAVLIAVVDRPEGASVILTKRNDRLRAHSGQISFPGGAIDVGDASPEWAALRETEEEIGLDPSLVEVVGRLPDYVTGSGYRIAPVLGIVQPGFVLTINPDEVDDVFEVPLAFLMEPGNHIRDSKVWQEKERFFYAMPHGERHIWGITAGIIRMLYERLYA